MFKILQARLQQYVNHELPDVQAGLRKGRGTEIKLPTSIGSEKKQESSRKISTSDLLMMPKPLTSWIKTDCGKFFKRRKYQTTWLASWEICIQVKKQQLELDMEQFFCIAFLRDWNENWPFPFLSNYFSFSESRSGYFQSYNPDLATPFSVI